MRGLPINLTSVSWVLILIFSWYNINLLFQSISETLINFGHWEKVNTVHKVKYNQFMKRDETDMFEVKLK